MTFNSVKYPKTFHFPDSPGIRNDDKVIKDISHFKGQEVVITEKIDGENTTLAYNRIHARSMDSKDHPSRHWVKANYAYLTRTLNPWYRICGENVYAEHSIHYINLESYFLAFNVWRNNFCLSWDTSVAFLQQYLIPTVPIIYVGVWDEDIISECKKLKPTEKGETEGFVVRLKRIFTFDEFQTSVIKYLRPNHVQTDTHWLYKPLIKNELKCDL